jgi:hypothetical protein
MGDNVIVAYLKYKYLGNWNKATEYNDENFGQNCQYHGGFFQPGIYRKSQYNYKNYGASLFACDIISRILKLEQYHIFRSAIRSLLPKVFKEETLSICANCDFPAGCVPSTSTNHHLSSYNFSGASSSIWCNHFVKCIWLLCIQNNVG